MSSLKVDELYEVRRLLERSTSIDPNYARAYAMISDAHVAGWVHPLDGDHLNPNALDRAYQFAREAVRLDPNLPQARVSLGLVSGYLDQHDGMMSEFEKAMVLNPNFTDWRFGRGLIVAGEFERAIEFLKAHIQLDPFSPPIAHALLGLAYYMLKRYSEALGPLRESVLRSPHFRPGHVWLAATYAQKGELQAARNEAAEVLRIQPGWTIDGFGRRLMNFKHS